MASLFPEFAVSTYPRFLFVDMNAFYTSVEQQECAQYRDKPVIVVPVLAEGTCAIAASYEAKKLGVKTGTSVRLARDLSIELQIVEARPSLYLDYHARLVATLREQFATVKVLSVDEMACRLPASCKTSAQEEALARTVKQCISDRLGPQMRCSIGIGPNIFLAKVASERQKPDGLTIWDGANLPDALFALSLIDLPGIGPAMKRRLETAGITSVEALWEATPIDLRRAWGSVVGAKWYYMLRGSRDLDYQPMQASEARKSLGHSNVLAPEHRTTNAARGILLELFAKALKRMRSYYLLASSVQITAKYRRTNPDDAYTLRFVTKEGIWMRRSRKHLHTSDERTWLKVVRPMLDALPDLSPRAEPCYVSVVFGGLLARQDLNLNLFDEITEKERLASIVDALNQKHGAKTELATLHGQAAQIPLRISFGAPDENAAGAI